MLRYLYQGITFQEVPNEVSMTFFLLGCPKHCKGCHSEDYWDTNVSPTLGKPFTLKELENTINENIVDYANCSTLLFMGGEWKEREFFDTIKEFYNEHMYGNLNLQSKKLAWYIGKEHDELKYSRYAKSYFDILKTGEYKEELGGLKSKTTNQDYMIKAWEIVTAIYFHSDGELE